MSNLAAMIIECARSQNIHTIIDIGAGQGYLSRVLAHYGFTVYAIDGNPKQTCGAQWHDSYIETHLPFLGQLYHLQKEFTQNTFQSIFSEILKEISLKCSCSQNGCNQCQRILLCGLHACGPLSSFVCQLFVENPYVSALCVVPCCHHFLSRDCDIQPSMFPISSMQCFHDFKMCNAAFMVANQSPSSWKTRLDIQNNFSRHFHRALLQVRRKKKNRITYRKTLKVMKSLLLILKIIVILLF